MKDVNVKIWDCEESIRKMGMENPPPDFIKCARNIQYI